MILIKMQIESINFYVVDSFFSLGSFAFMFNYILSSTMRGVCVYVKEQNFFFPSPNFSPQF